jgi:hypothetical protein
MDKNVWIVCGHNNVVAIGRTVASTCGEVSRPRRDDLNGGASHVPPESLGDRRFYVLLTSLLVPPAAGI